MNPILIADSATIPGVDTVLLTYGPLGVFALVVLYFVVRWGDKIASGHVELVRVCGTTQTSIASSLERIGEATDSFLASSNSQRDECKKTQVIAGHIARGHLAEATNAESKRHYERAVDEAGNY